MLLDLVPPGLRPCVKAIAPAVLALLVAAGHGAGAGTIDAVELEVAIVGLVAASVTFAVDNAPEGLRHYAKALAPALLTLAGVVIHAAIGGVWDQQTWTIGLTGLGSALVAGLVSNAPPAKAPARRRAVARPRGYARRARKASRRA